jgi:hypothetical protein
MRQEPLADCKGTDEIWFSLTTDALDRKQNKKYFVVARWNKN